MAVSINDAHDLELMILALGFSRGSGGLTGVSSSIVSNILTLTLGGTITNNIQPVSNASLTIKTVATSAFGPALNLTAGDSASAVSGGGGINLQCGSAFPTTGVGAGGSFSLFSGSGGVSGTGGAGGSMTFTAGTGGGTTGKGGNITFLPGNATAVANAGFAIFQDGQNATNAFVIGSSGATATIGFFQGAATGGAVQSTGYGTPTNGVKLSNFNGSTATAAQTTAALAQLLLDLKAYGLLGA